MEGEWHHDLTAETLTVRLRTLVDALVICDSDYRMFTYEVSLDAIRYVPRLSPTRTGHWIEAPFVLSPTEIEAAFYAGTFSRAQLINSGLLVSRSIRIPPVGRDQVSNHRRLRATALLDEAGLLSRLADPCTLR